MAEIGIVGAGLTGVTAAERIRAAGHGVTLLDKGRSPGGRLSSREAAGCVIDHAAPWVSADDPDFVSWLEDHSAVRYAAIRGQGWIGSPRMSALIGDPEGAVPGVKVTGITWADGAWQVIDADGGHHGPFAGLVLAIPAPQAAELLAPAAEDLASSLDRVRMAPIWTLILACEEALRPTADRSRPAEIDYLARMADRPGRRNLPDGYAMHMTEAYSREHVDVDRDSMTPRLLDIFATAIGLPLPKPAYISAQRWRYARTAVPLGQPMLADADRRLFVGGDWTLGPTAQAAWRSGRTMGDAVAAAVTDG